MAEIDLTGFNLNNLKKNLTEPGKQVNAEPLYIPYLKNMSQTHNFTSGFKGVQDIKDAIAALESGGPEAIPEAQRKGLNTAILREVKDMREVSPEFNRAVNAQRKAIAGKASDEDVSLAAQKIGEKLSEDFETRYARPPTQGESAALFNQLEFGHVGNPNDPETFQDLVNSASWEGVFNSFDAKIPLIEAANSELKNIGKELGPEEVSKILAKGLTPERADVLTSSIVKQLTEAEAKAKLEQVKPERMKAIDELDASLAKSQADYLSNDITPAIVTALRNRGLTAGPELQSVLAEVSQGLGRERESRIAPLRAQTALEAPEAAFNFAMNGASEAGRAKTSATDFLRNINVMDRGNTFTASQSALDRLFKQNQADQQTALMMAMMGGQSKQPSALDYFLQYGLPVIGSAAGGWASKK